MNANQPQYNNFEKTEALWIEQYPNAQEELPRNAPKPHGEAVMLTCYVDSNHAHDLQMRRSVLGYIILINLMPIIWHLKHQCTVKMSAHGTEFVAMLMAVEEIIRIHYTL